MTRTRWIIVLVGAGVLLAILIGVLGTRNDNSESKTEALSNLCSSVETLGSSVKSLTSLDAGTASKSQYQSAVSAVQTDWDQVKTDFTDVQNASSGQLDSAWNSFSTAVKNVPNDASVSDALNEISQSAEQLASAAQATAASLSCS
jgi:hypothetical protein